MRDGEPLEFRGGEEFQTDVRPNYENSDVGD